MPHIGNHVDAIFLPESVNTSTTLKINGGDLNVNNGQFFVDQSTTNVGIGTATPSTLLDIYGDGQNTAQLSLRQWNDNSGSDTFDGPDIRFFCSGGTIASPVEPDTGDILGKVNAFVNTGSSYDQFGGFGWTYRTQGSGPSIDRGSSFAIETKSLYETAHSAKIYISEEGNVGIRTASPFRTFQINGSYNSSTSEYGAPNQWFINSLSSASAGTNLGSIVFSRSTGSTGASAKIQATATGTANETDLYFYNRTSGGADNVNNYLNTTPTLKLYHDKTAEFASDVKLPDDAKLLLGTDDDFQIYYDGGTAHIDNNQGQIRMRAASSFLFYYEGSGGNEDYAKFLQNGAVELYHNNNKAFETTSTGIDVPLGTITGPATLNIDPAAVGDNTGTVIIKGSLQVDGTTTTINSTTLTVDDKNIVLASGAANSAAADGAGITVDGANATLIYNSTPDAWSFNKNVGIGTDNPQEKLHVLGTSSDFVVDTDSSALRFGSYGEYDIALVTGRNTATDSSRVYIENGDGEALRIDSSGRLLVGASSSSANTKFLVEGGTASNNANLFLARSNAPSGTTTGNKELGSIAFSANNHVASAVILGERDGGTWTNGVSQPTRLVFSSTADGSSSPTERLRIDSTGNVGIGTNSPSAKLHVSGGDLYVNSLDGSEVDIKLGIHATHSNFGIIKNVRASNSQNYLSFNIHQGFGGYGLYEALQIHYDDGLYIKGPKSYDTTAYTGDVAYILFGDQERQFADLVVESESASSRLAAFVFKTKGSTGFFPEERLRITAAGEVLINESAARSYVDGAGNTQTPKLQVESDDNTSTAISLQYNAGGGAANRRASFIFARTADGTAVADNSVLGEVLFMGEGNNTLEKAASIRAEVDGTPGTNDMPGRLIFSTSADGSDSPTERLRITSAGEVGIGTDNPGEKLDVRGKIRIEDDNPSPGLLIRDADANGDIGIYQFNSGDLQILNNATSRNIIFQTHNGTSVGERLRIASSGRLGVGVDNPNSNLHVKGGSESTDNLLLTLQSNGVANDGSLSTGLRLINSTSDTSIHGADIRAIRTSSSTADLTFSLYNGSTPQDERLRITSAGDLLVNHDSSDGSGKLQVFTGSQDGIDILGFSNSATAGGRLTFYRSKSNTVGNFSEVGDGDSLGRIDWRGYNDDGTTNNLGATIEALVSGFVNSTTDMPSDLVFKTSPDGSSSPSERLRITSGGNVQLKTANAQLEWQAASGAINPFIRSIGTDQQALEFNTGGSPRVRIGSGGNVGIGTDDQGAKLHVHGTTNSGGILVEDSSTATQAPAIKVIGKRQDGNVHHSFSGKLLLAKNRTNAKIQGSDSILGTVAFGGNHTNSSMSNILYAAAIHGVAENSFDANNDMPTALVFRTGSTGRSGDTNNVHIGDERLRIGSGGNVGIGTNVPNTKLDVFGTIKSSTVAYGMNQDGTYLIAGSTSWSGATSNWGTYGFQHKIKSNAGGTSRITVDTVNGEALCVLNDNKIGIGTNNPQGTVHISSGTSGDCELILESDTDNNEDSDNPRIIFKQDGGIEESAIEQLQNELTISNSVVSAGGIVFKTGTTNGYTNATESLRITSSGQIGVGTSTVARGPLHIHQGTTGDTQIHMTNSETGTSSSDGFTIFQGAGNGEDCGFVNRELNGRIRFLMAEAGMDGNPVVSDKMILTSNGSLGIKTTTPARSLHVNGVGYFTSRVGIGTTDNTSYQLTVKNSVSESVTGGILVDCDGWTTNTTKYGINVDIDSSNRTNLTANRTHRGISSDMRVRAAQNASNTSGTRQSVYGIYSSAYVDDTDNNDGKMYYVWGTYSRGRVDGVNCANLRGGYFLAQAGDNATGQSRTVDNAYGIYANMVNDGNQTTFTSAYGVYANVNQDDSGGAMTNAYGVMSKLDRDAGTGGVGHLYRGDFDGTWGTKRGLWLTGDTENSVAGSFTAASKNFRIPHPLPELSETKDLVHVSVESPAHDLIYRGKSELVDGFATINLDTESGMTEGTFVALNRNIQCFTSNESDWSAVRGSVSGNILTIECQDSSSTALISWMVIGERQDDKVKSLVTTDADGNLILEPDREPEEPDTEKAEIPD